ncbi:MAG TPA: acyltransferase, partial [Acidimicrobiales bacterium]
MTALARPRSRLGLSLRNPAARWQRWSETAAPAPDTPTGLGAPMPRLPALDGLRGVAVIGVLFFHGGFSWATGGFLGVSTFFTLSGFLITNLLVREHDRTQTIRLRAFWSRRFRRLLPAALAALVLIALYGQVYASPEQLQDLRGDALAALAYVANWRLLFEGKSYGDLFSAPSPVQHFWSLSIEEQFYVLFPILVYVSLRVGGRRLLTGVLVAAAAASVATSFALSGSVDHVYYGTDTRAFELLAGALFAVWWSGRTVDSSARFGSWSRAAFGAVAVAALAATVWSWTFAEETSERLGRGGLALHAVLVVAVIAAIVRRSLLATVLSFAPL